jgi:pimeloyl-ACP methyl ester carboxylesterase
MSAPVIRIVSFVAFGAAVLAFAALWLTTSLVIDYSPKGRQLQPSDFAQLAGQVSGGVEVEHYNSSDGVALSAWYLPASLPANAERWAVILTPGGGGDKTYYLPLGERLRAAGFDVMLIDLRGHGESGRSPRGQTLGVTEGRDVAAAAAFLAEQKGVRHIAALGVSMGGVSAVMGAAAEPRIGPLIVESSNHRAQGVFDYIMRMFHVPAGAMSDGISHAATQLALWRFGAPLADISAGVLPTWRLALGLAPRSTLFITGDRDPLVAVDDVRSFAARFAGQSEVVVVPGVAHGVYKVRSELYADLVLRFLTQWRDAGSAAGAAQ